MAKLSGEVPAGELESFRRAGGPVFELVEQVEKRQLECRIDGLDPWTVPPATRAAFLCAWNAFVLQTVANDLVEADYALDRHTPGHLPAATAEQALRFYRQVEGWVSRGSQALANPAYRLDVPVPDPLPPWHRTRPVAPAHLHSLVHAMRSVREHADAAMAFLPDAAPGDAEKQAQLNRIRQLHAQAQVSARYADEMAPQATPAANDRAADHARSAIEQFYLLGQLIADPALANGLPAAAEPPRKVGPGRAAPPAPGAAPRLAGGWPVGTAPAPSTPAPRAAQPPPAAPPPRPAPKAPPAPLAGSPEGHRSHWATGMHLADGWPVPGGPAPRPAEERAPAPAQRLVTRHDTHRGQTITEWPVPVEFAGRLEHDARFELRPMLVRGREGETPVLRIGARSGSGFTRLTQGTITLHADGLEVALFPWPGAQSRMSTRGGRALYEEEADFPVHRAMLDAIPRAKSLRLRIDTGHGTLQPETETMARIQSCCHDFLHALHARDADPRYPRPKRT
jgi:hypothetical protein